jgi:hypothetical protein
MAMPALLRREKGAHLVSPGRRSRVERGGRAWLERGIFKPQHFAGVAETGIAALARPADGGRTTCEGLHLD